MNCTVLVVLVFASLDGYLCQSYLSNSSAKIVTYSASNSEVDQDNDVQIRENAANYQENVQYVSESGGKNSYIENDHAPPVSTWEGHWALVPTVATFSLRTGVPMSSRELQALSEDPRGKGGGGGGFRVKKKYQKYLLPLLLAYKLKFFTLIPVMIGGLILLVGATGLAGFFFALFAAVMGLKGGHGGH